MDSFLQLFVEVLFGWLLYFVFLMSCVTVSVLCLFLTVQWVGLQCVIVAFPGHTF